MLLLPKNFEGQHMAGSLHL